MIQKRIVSHGNSEGMQEVSNIDLDDGVFIEYVLENSQFGLKVKVHFDLNTISINADTVYCIC